jgi:predicted deacetylase
MESVAAADFLPVMAVAAPKRHLVVSIHDVAPSNRAVVEEMMREIASKGVRVSSLLVVPDYHHQGNFAQDRQFTSWLRDLEAQGNEIVIHGYFHERPSRPDESFADKFVTRFYTRGEGEFYDLDYDEAFRRIRKARDEFIEAGLRPRGFIAPAWLLNSEGERAVRDADLEYTTRLQTVRDVRSPHNFSARSLVYSTEAPWRRSTSIFWNGTLVRLQRTAALLRVSIHPPDRQYPRIWRQILDLIDEGAKVRTPTTYRDWIAEQRVNAAQA